MKVLPIVAAALSLSASLSASTGAMAQDAQPQNIPVHNIVLVHGAWVDGSGWKPVYDRLTKDGYHVTIVQEPLSSLEDMDHEQILRRIDAARPDILMVAFGNPKQEKWMLHMRPRLSAPLLVGVGAAFDFHAGLVSQAPPWMQRSGLEWTYRLSREPKRLWRRYAYQNPRFIAGFTRQYIHQRFHHGS